MKIKKKLGPITLPLGMKIDTIELDLEFDTAEDYKIFKEEERKDDDKTMEMLKELTPVLEDLSSYLGELDPLDDEFIMEEASHMDYEGQGIKESPQEVVDTGIEVGADWFKYKEDDEKITLVPTKSEDDCEEYSEEELDVISFFDEDELED